MMYNTHKKYGQVAGVAAIPVAMDLGIMEKVNFSGSVDNILMELVIVAVSLIIAIKSSVLGSDIPDLDCDGVAAKKHKFLRSIFHAMGLRHRGKFSHDFTTHLVIFAIMFFGLNLIQQNVSGIEVLIIGFVKLSVFFQLVGIYSHLIADALTVDGVWVLWKFKLKVMPVFIRKVNILGWKPFKNAFRADSSWNDINFAMMKVALPIVSILSAMIVLK